MVTRIGVALGIAVCLLAGTAVEAATFKGRIIYVQDDALEVKKKNREMTFRLTGETVIIRDGVRAESEDLDLCQTVRVTYKGKGKKPVALKVEILRESDCISKPVPGRHTEEIIPGTGGGGDNAVPGENNPAEAPLP